MVNSDVIGPLRSCIENGGQTLVRKDLLPSHASLLLGKDSAVKKQGQPSLSVKFAYFQLKLNTGVGIQAIITISFTVNFGSSDEIKAPMDTAMNPSVPSLITGGCLCGGVRYEVKFAPNHDFKAKSHNCQCTDCRKQSGSLIIHWHAVSGPELTWTSKSTLGEYSHSPGIRRFFCRTCGGTLAWQDEKEGGTIEFTVGTVDEKWLIGENVTESDGKITERLGSILADPNGEQFWSGKMISGVTDTLPGPKDQRQ